MNMCAKVWFNMQIGQFYQEQTKLSVNF